MEEFKTSFPSVTLKEIATKFATKNPNLQLMFNQINNHLRIHNNNNKYAKIKIITLNNLQLVISHITPPHTLTTEKKKIFQQISMQLQ